MPSTATPAEIAEQATEVKDLDFLVDLTRTCLRLQDNTNADLDRLAGDLVRFSDRLRIARNILGDMEAGAGDFYLPDADDERRQMEQVEADCTSNAHRLGLI